MNKTGFSKIRFWVLVLVSAVQKLLTLMELRERERFDSTAAHSLNHLHLV